MQRFRIGALMRRCWHTHRGDDDDDDGDAPSKIPDEKINLEKHCKILDKLKIGVCSQIRFNNMIFQQMALYKGYKVFRTVTVCFTAERKTMSATICKVYCRDIRLVHLGYRVS